MKRLIPALAVALALPALAAAGELRFTDHMARLGLAEPGYAWHAYHDAIVCADWDDDGDVDVLVVVSLHEKGPKGAQGRLYVNLLAETGKLAFEDRTEKLIPDGTQRKIIADSHPVFLDVDADGDLDMSVVSDEHRPVTFLNEGGRFRMVSWGFRGQNLIIRDFDGDGDLDVLSSNTGDLDLSEGAGKFRRTKSTEYLCGHMPRDKVLPTPAGIVVDDEIRTMATAKGHVYYAWEKLDFTGDGRDDYALSLSLVYSWKRARFYAKTATGYRDVTQETSLPTDAKIRFLDLTGDGRLDATATQRKTGGVFLGDGKGHFTRAAASDATKVFRTVIGGCYTMPQVIADFDADGVPDVVTYQPRIGVGDVVMRGLGAGRFDVALRTKASSGQAVADLDNDGLLDVVASGPRRSKGLHVWINETTDPGRRLRVRLKGPPANPFAANAVVEAFPAGKLGVTTTRIARAVQTADGLPVILGLAVASKIDLRVTFAPGVVVERRSVEATGEIRIAAPTSTDGGNR